MTVTRANIIVLGDVQGVGYRYFVRKVAWKNKISGHVGNLEDGTVKIICEGNENNIKNFLKLIVIQKPPIAVERIDVEFSKASGEFKGFSEVKEEIHLLRDDFRELFMHEVSELRGEIAEIKSTLARMQAAG